MVMTPLPLQRGRMLPLPPQAQAPKVAVEAQPTDELTVPGIPGVPSVPDGATSALPLPPCTVQQTFPSKELLQ